MTWIARPSQQCYDETSASFSVPVGGTDDRHGNRRRLESNEPHTVPGCLDNLLGGQVRCGNQMLGFVRTFDDRLLQRCFTFGTYDCAANRVGQNEFRNCGRRLACERGLRRGRCCSGCRWCCRRSGRARDSGRGRGRRCRDDCRNLRRLYCSCVLERSWSGDARLAQGRHRLNGSRRATGYRG